MLRYVFALLCLFAALPFSGPPQGTQASKIQPPAHASCDTTAEDYLVYSAILADLGQPEDPEEEWRDKTKIVISDATDTSENGDNKGWGFRSRSKQSPLPETIRNFNSRAKYTCHLEAGFTAKIPLTLAASDALTKIFKKRGDGWKRFYALYPNSSGYWGFSNVGYSDNGQEALVFVGHHCGWLCGTGHLFLLAKEDGAWVVKNRVMLWIS